MIALPGIGRIGYATPRAAGCNARRNKMKRRFRAAVLEMVRPHDLDMVVAISANADRAPFSSIREDLRSVLGRMKKRWADELESS